MQRLSGPGLGFIARFEGYRNRPYNDQGQNATIGYGHLLHYGPVNLKDRIRWAAGCRPARALQLLQGDAARAELAVRRMVHVPLAQHEFDALTSFTFNCGAGALAHSSLLRALNRGGGAEVPALLLHWDHVGGQVSPGLKRRRAAEGKVWSHGDYGC